MKFCTDISQSKAMAKILPESSNDLWWSRCTITDFGDGALKVSYAVEPCNISQFRYTKEDVPCWSLVALLDVLKSGDYRFSLEYFKDEGWGARSTFNSVTRPDLLSVSNEPIDACCKLILELNKGGLL